MISQSEGLRLVRTALVDELGVANVRATANSLWFRYESVRLHIFVHEQRELDRTVIQIRAPVVFDVPLSPALFEFIATSGWMFGCLTVTPERTGVGQVQMTHTLIAEYCHPRELAMVAGAILGTVEQLDDQMMDDFGGHTSFGGND